MISIALAALTTQYPGYQLIVTGHSLGGAVATLAGLTLLNAGYSPTVYSFGSPRVGNAPFAAYTSKILVYNYRVTHYRDLIPHIPPRSLHYLHTGEEVYEDKDHILTMCTQVEDPSCADRWTLIQTSLADHFLYLNRVMDCPV